MNAAVLSCVVGLAVSAVSVSFAQPGAGPEGFGGPEGRNAQFDGQFDGRRGPDGEGRPGRPGGERAGKRGGEGRGDGQGPRFERLLERFDTDGDGTVSDAEKDAAKAQREVQQAERAQEMATRMLERFDADENGALDATELAAMMEQRPQRGDRGPRGQRGQRGTEGGKRGDGSQGGPGARLRRALTPDQIAQFDTDGDGKLTREEAEASRDEIKTIMEQKRQEVVDRFDADGNGELDQSEREAVRNAHRQERRVMQADLNKNGVLDADELEKALELIKSQAPEADFNNDGTVDTKDMTLLLDTLPSA